MNLYRFEGAVQNNAAPLGLFVPALAGAAFLSALEYAATAMTGILIGLGIYEATASDNDEVTGGEMASAENASTETCKVGKCKKPKPNCPDEEYKKLNSEVKAAKNVIRGLGGCTRNSNLTPDERKVRAVAWKRLAEARTTREDTCFNGGDENHKREIREAWRQYHECSK